MNDTNTQITEEFEKSDDLNVNDSSVIIQNDINQQNNLSTKKHKRLNVKWIVLIALTIITGAIAIYMAISFGKVYIKEQKELKTDIIEMTNNVIVPDYISNSTWEDKKAIAEMMENEDTSQWGQEFLKKVYENTTEEKNYYVHEYMYIPLQFEYLIDKRARVDSELDVCGNVAHGTLEVDLNMLDSELRQVEQPEEYFMRTYELYRELRDGKLITYIKNGDKWYSYESKDKHTSVTITPKAAAELYTSEQVRSTSYAMISTNEKSAVTIAIDSIPSKHMHRFFHPSFYASEMGVFAYKDYTLSSVNTLSLKLDINKIKNTYSHLNDKVLGEMAKNGTLIHNSYGIQFDKYGLVKEIKIPQDVVDNAIKVNDLNFIYNYLFEELDVPCINNEDNNVEKAVDSVE